MFNVALNVEKKGRTFKAALNMERERGCAEGCLELFTWFPCRRSRLASPCFLLRTRLHSPSHSMPESLVSRVWFEAGVHLSTPSTSS